MPADVVYASRVMQLELLDADGTTIGRVADIVLAPATPAPPRVVGFVAGIGRHRVFVSAGKVTELNRGGVRLRSAAIDLRSFERRAGEVLASDLIDRQIDGDELTDFALRRSSGRTSGWEVSTVAVRTRSGLRRRPPRLVPWREMRQLFDDGTMPAEMADYRDMHPSDVAGAVRKLPLERRRQLAAAMEDERLADVLEELDEEEQVRLIEGIDVERLAHVLAEMAPDDAVDLLAELPRDRQRILLDAMAPDEADPLRALLRYGEHTAGGLMTPEPIIIDAAAPVAEVLARLREPDLAAALAAQAFVVEPPLQPPTGRYLGTIGFQRLLREPPSTPVGRVVEAVPGIPPITSEAEVAARLASYNLLALAVVDDQDRLLGAVSIDDVLDAVLPEGWRARVR